MQKNNSKQATITKNSSEKALQEIDENLKKNHTFKENSKQVEDKVLNEADNARQEIYGRNLAIFYAISLKVSFR